MSWQDRPYAHGRAGRGGGFGGGGYGGGGMRLSFPRPAGAVKWLLIANAAVFVAQALTRDFHPGGGALTAAFGANAAAWWQAWRYITFQFLHGGVWHLFLNMLGLYMLGTPVEQRFGSKRFLQFYLLCGVVAGAAYVLISLWQYGPNRMPIVGASGGVYGIIVAAAVYFPHFRLIFLFFPVPIRTAAVFIFGIMVLTILQGLGGTPTAQFWSQVAHFGGAVTGGAWIWLAHHRRPPRRPGGGGLFTPKTGKSGWDKKMQEREKTRKEVDRILDKIHTRGIGSLSKKEKKVLKDASDQQREEDRRIRRL